MTERFSPATRYAEAFAFQVLRFETATMGADHPSTLATLHNIADALAEQGKHAEAEAQYRQVLDTATSILGPSRPNTLSTRTGIARSMAAQGNQEDT
jgi:hypothetical protein